MARKPKNCLTCKHASSRDTDYLGRTWYIACAFRVPKSMPECWRFRAPYIEYNAFDLGERAAPTVEVCHDEYFDERVITDCAGHRRGRNNLVVFRDPEGAE